MCTVTYFPLKDKIVLTSNRDEKPNRSAQEIHNEKGIFYPKDATKNGTWFAVTKSGNAIVLLNGAFENHQRKTEYRKSRGLIVLDLISTKNVFKSLELIDLQNIEPFTLVIFQETQLAEFRWDGTEKYFKILDSNLPYIWSSATLYDNEAQEKRNAIFKKFLENETINEGKIWDFHQQKTDDLENGITIKRQNTIQTISTTQVIIADEITLKHYDRLNLSSKTEKIFLKNETQTSAS
ncbi:NRDE family protein [Chryseobacterium binzhouense]|uniref:NRDE family protein n=1 Tax=Chryseobacterium binzhouense TaxID=2593646 RepID=UPI0011808ACF|nr:NRDE family protein [Chryseobacterium binzhouense]